MGRFAPNAMDRKNRTGTRPTLRFIDPLTAGPEGIVAVDRHNTLDVATLQRAYRQGIFPWPHEGMPLLWFCPDPRAILEFQNLHVGERLGRLRRNTCWSFTIDTDFDGVIAACRHIPRGEEEGTWITSAMEQAYRNLHRAGAAHSVEVWDEGGQLVGGLYGVSVCGTFAGESMFHRSPNSSKLALLFLMGHLKARGLSWIDIQMLTPHMAALGATLVSRQTFLQRLAQTQEANLALFDPVPVALPPVTPGRGAITDEKEF